MPRYENDHLCSDVIAKHARSCGRAEAVVCEGVRLTWEQLEQKTNQVANALLALGCGKGTKVCTLMPNSIDSFVIFWGTIKAGCVIAPLNVMLDEASLALLANSSDGVILFVDPSTVALAERARPEFRHIRADGFFEFGGEHPGWRSAEALLAPASTAPPPVKNELSDSMTLYYSSGTTGLPKGAEHSHFGRLNYPYAFAPGLGINRHSVAICATPTYASGTLITMLPTMYCGGKVVLLRKFSAEAFLEAVVNEAGSHAFMVPTQYIAILQHGPAAYDTASLRSLITAGQPLSDTTRAALAAEFPTAGLYEVYGMTEGFFTLAIPEDFRRGKRGTVGKPGFLEDIRIIGEDDREAATGETGEIVAYGPGMMKGYYGRPDLTEAAIWQNSVGRTFLRSGDLGRVDADGFVYVSGRKKDMIKSGGINIYPVDIEQIIMSHPAVSEVAVIGVPHPRWGESPLGIVIARPGEEIDADQLLGWINERLSKYQRLLAVILRDDVPRATYGKIQKDRLREEYRNQAEHAAT